MHENKVDRLIEEIKCISYVLNSDGNMDVYAREYYNIILLSKMTEITTIFYNFWVNNTKKVVKDNREYPQKTFTLEELKIYDGSKGKPAYVAIDGIIYDVSNEATWGGGTHFGLFSGKNLTLEFMGCHGDKSKLDKLPKVGILKI